MRQLPSRVGRRIGGFIPKQVRSDLWWEVRALAIRVRTATRRPPDVGPGPYRLNVGAGSQRVPGWITVDMEKGADILADVRWRIPLPDGSVEMLFSEHTIEHVRYPEVARFLAECHRLLARGAPLRISVPDASKYLKGYTEGDLEELSALHPWGETPMTTVNWLFHGYGHRFGWDEETLRRALTAAGFVDVTRRSFRDTDYPGLDIDRPEREVESLYMEARRPA